MTAISQKYAGAFNGKPEPSPLEARAAVAAGFTTATVAVFVLIVGVFAGARLWQLAAYSLSSDEVFSLAAARLGWSDLIGFVIEDVVHPPLFYLLFKLWIMIGGESLLWLKLFPALVSIGAILPFLLLCRELKLRAAEINLALLLMAVNGYMIFYAQDVRMYSLVLLLTLCSLWLFARFYNRSDGARKHLLALSAINLLLVYTQYYGWLVVGVEGLFLLFWKREKFLSFLMSVAVLMLCFSPWAYAVARTAMSVGLDNSGRTEPVRWTEFVVFYTTLNGSVPHWTRAGLLLFAYPVVWWSRQAFRRRQGVDTEPAAALLVWLLLLSFVPVVIAFCVGQVFPKSLASRYLIIVAAPYMIMVAVAACRLRPAWVRTATLILMIGYAALAGYLAVKDEPYRIKLEALVQQLIQAEPRAAGPVMVYTDQRGMTGAMMFYLEQAEEKRFHVERVDDLDDVEGEYLWVLGRNELDPTRKRQQQEEWAERGYQVGEGLDDGDGNAFLFPVRRR